MKCIDLDFGCVDLYFGFLDLYLGVWTCTLNVWTYIWGVLYKSINFHAVLQKLQFLLEGIPHTSSPYIPIPHYPTTHPGGAGMHLVPTPNHPGSARKHLAPTPLTPVVPACILRQVHPAARSGSTMSVPWHCQGQCCGSAIGVLWHCSGNPMHCHGTAMALPWHCMAMPWHCHCNPVAVPRNCYGTAAVSHIYSNR